MLGNYDRLTDYGSAEPGERITGSRGKKLKR